MLPDSVTELPPGPSLSASDTTFQWLARPFALLDECAAEYGDTFTLRFKRLGTHVVVSHPDDVRLVFAGDPRVLHAGRGNTLLEPILGGRSLLVLDGEVHAKQRARLQGTFRPDRIPEYARVVAAATRRWTASWNGASTVRMQRVALEISKEVILRIVLGVEEDELERFSRLIDALMLLVGTNTPLDEPAGDERVGQRFRSARGALDAALQEHMERRRCASGGDDLLATLLSAGTESGDRLSDEEIRDQLITMLLAGHETTANSIAWALVCLNEQPEALGKLIAELDEAGEGVPAERLNGLAYLQAVCMETLRLRPVIPVVSRELQEPFRLRDCTLPAGVFVSPSPYLAHRRGESFAEPGEFRPERFLDRRYSPYVYFPFGGGVRRCIGMSFALLEMQIVLGMLVRTFRFTSLGPVRAVRRAVTIVASGGAKMRVQRRLPS
jgi:cytochrome P450